MVWKELEWPLRFLSQSGLPQQRESAVVPCAETIRKARLERNGFAEAGQPISIAGRKSRKKIDVQKRGTLYVARRFGWQYDGNPRQIWRLPRISGSGPFSKSEVLVHV
ncbi:hypothetical protein CAY57_14410 [Heyndrickxia coagulans]|nr:hypothetical protein CAY57_14410 [Heyndrickxia coagulans]